MKLSDFLEELNQWAEKAFGENAKRMIDSLLYAEVPPKLKRSVNMARLENGTYGEIVAHLEGELELNTLEESDDMPIANMASAFTKNSILLSNGINTNKDAHCSYCKATGHFYESFPKLKKKKELENKNGKKPQRQTYPECKKDFYVPNGHTLTTRPMIPPEKKRHPRSQVPQKQTLRANQLLAKTIQKTNFATTPNM